MTEAPSQNPIRYPFAAPPEKGEWITVAPGVYWLQMALPMALDHINLYVLEDEQGWYIVDTGMKWGDTQERWRLLFDGPMAGKPLLGVICTHMHPDHIGQAGWLCREFRVPLYMSFGEYVSSRMFSTMGEGDLEWTTALYFQRSGIPLDAIEKMRAKFKGFGNIVEPMPKAYQRLRDGQVMNIGGRRWQVMTGSGHSPEHVSLFSAEDKLLLSGDQIIPRITSNVSVMPAEPDANPLADWFAALTRFREALPADTLVMPAHNAPFYGVHYRLEYLVDHHKGHLAAVEKACETPKTAVELFSVLFAREIEMNQLTLALGESVAHLHYLYYQGRLKRELDDNGAYRYSSLDPDGSPYSRCPHEPDDGPLEV